MKRFLFVAALLAAPLLALTAAEESAPASSRMKEVLRARAAEEAKKQPAPPAKPQPVTAKTPAPSAPVSPDAKKDEPPSPAPTTPTAVATPAQPAETATKDAPAVLPEVEVRKSRITELDIQLKEQAKEIRREQKNTKPTEMDEALNHPKLSKILSIFGGESSKHRAGLAQERVELMEAEGDLMEAIAQAKTKEEKAELEKQLDQIKAFRRELEKSLR